jgi:hypothetical protein
MIEKYLVPIGRGYVILTLIHLLFMLVLFGAELLINIDKNTLFILIGVYIISLTTILAYLIGKELEE